MNKGILILCLFFLTQCYTEPFFELTVSVVDENLNPVSNAIIKIEVIDIDNGNLVDGSIINLESISGENGEALFSFDNKAFVTSRVCYDNNVTQQFLCKEGYVYLEANTNKKLTLMIQNENCSFCL